MANCIRKLTTSSKLYGISDSQIACAIYRHMLATSIHPKALEVLEQCDVTHSVAQTPQADEMGLTAIWECRKHEKGWQVERASEDC